MAVIQSLLTTVQHTTAANGKISICFINCNVSGTKFMLGVVYSSGSLRRIMNHDSYNVFRNQLRHTDCYCITGDSNFPDINKSTMSPNASEKKHFPQMLNEENMIHNMSEPTKLNAVLDLCLTPNDNSISDLKVDETFSTRDHSYMTFRFNMPIVFQKKKITYRNF